MVSTIFRVESAFGPASSLTWNEGIGMDPLVSLFDDFRKAQGGELHLPEYRGLEMYSAKKRSADNHA